MNKAQVYNTIVKIQKESGQGLSGLVTAIGANAELYLTHINSLVEEGLVIKNDAGGGSIGHPSSSIFYTPSKGYNVWAEDNSMRDLTLVRFYLGRLEEADEVRKEDDTARFINPAAIDLIRNPKRMKAYTEWLEKNQEALLEMLALEEMDETQGERSEDIFSETQIEFIKDREWYTDNETIKSAISKSEERAGILNEKLRLQKQLMELYTEADEEYEKTKSEMKEVEEEISFRKTIKLFLMNQDDDVRTQEAFSFPVEA
ncbi:MAG: hypothetical protein P8J32_03330 [bacterium]|nr:hypothetical protein [bacterium]